MGIEQNNRNFRVVLLLCFIAVISSCLSTRQYNSLLRLKSKTGKTFVFGKVIDNHGSPLFGAVVQGSNLTNKIQTDRDGRYLLEVTDDSKEIKAYWLGYKHFRTKSIKLAKGDSLQLNFTMIESGQEIID